MSGGPENATLRRWRSTGLRRWVGAAAVLALFVAVSAYLAHQHKPLQAAGGADVACELCTQHGASADAPAIVPLRQPASRAWRLVPDYVSADPDRAGRAAYRSRAPPLT